MVRMRRRKKKRKRRPMMDDCATRCGKVVHSSAVDGTRD